MPHPLGKEGRHRLGTRGSLEQTQCEVKDKLPTPQKEGQTDSSLFASACFKYTIGTAVMYMQIFKIPILGI